jgi:putative peptidoglycan lipid II flippase
VAETLRSSGKVSLAVALSRVLGLVREQILAALFGASFFADAFAVAFRIPNLLRDLFAEGALSSALVPTFTEALVNEDRETAYRLGRLVFTLIFLITGALTLLGVVFAEEIVVAISDGFSGDAAKVELTTMLTRITMPFLSIISLSAVWMAMLNAQRSFMAPAYAPAMFNVAIIGVGAVLLILGLGPQQAIWWWSVGTVFAAVVQALVQLPALWRLGYRPSLSLRGLTKNPRLRRILTLMGPAVIGLAAVQINIFVNTIFAASLPGDGPLAQLSYAFRIFYLPVGVFSVALATVTTTRVSEDAARGDLKALRASAAEGMSGVWMLMSASAVGLWLLAEPVVQILFERGAFDHQATLATAAILQSYVLGLMSYGLIKILAPVYYGLDRVRVPILASICAVAVNISFNALTYEQLGAPGIALGTALGVTANFIVLRAALRKAVGSLAEHRRPRDAGALLVGNLVMGAVVWGSWAAYEGAVEAATLPLWMASTWSMLGLLGFLVALAFVVYVAILRGFAYPGAELLASLPGKILRKFSGRA